MNIPVIETSRLRLRGHRPGDLDATAAMWADPRVTRFIGGCVFSREESWARLLRYTGHWAWFGHGFWAIEHRDERTFLGALGFADFKRGIPAFGSFPEIGWSLTVDAQGHGYASESVRAASAWGDANLGVAKTVCLIDPGNTASIRVAQRCGFSVTGTVEYKDAPSLSFERLTPR